MTDDRADARVRPAKTTLMLRRSFRVQNTATDSARTPAAADVSAKNLAREGHAAVKARVARRQCFPSILDCIFAGCRSARPPRGRVPLVGGQWDGAADKGCRVCNICRLPVPPRRAGLRPVSGLPWLHICRSHDAGGLRALLDESQEISRRRIKRRSVSYTHLTLPTILRV